MPTNLSVERVPFQPWARELFDERQRTYLKDEPHVRCKPSGVARLFHTPYGLEILSLPDSGEVIFVGVGSPHSWRVVDLRATEHAAEREPARYGHSIGHWEGDTLVIDTVGFADSFWMNRLGLPHTGQLHTIERISRPNFDTLIYEVTIDDPGAYTASWSGGFYLNWRKGNEPFDYLCQDNNLDPERLVGPGRSSSDPRVARPRNRSRTPPVRRLELSRVAALPGLAARLRTRRSSRLGCRPCRRRRRAGWRWTWLRVAL